jgi:carbamoyl-phosphate synthase large subunit
VCKIPRWDLEKFEKVDQRIGSEMKSVGEVMAIGRSIEEVLQKALRNLDIWANGLVGNSSDFDFKEYEIDVATPKRMFAIARALMKWKSVEEIHKKTLIDIFFLEKLKNIVDTRKKLEEKLTAENLKEAKLRGFSDKQIAYIRKEKEQDIRNFRKKNEILPVVKR